MKDMVSEWKLRDIQQKWLENLEKYRKIKGKCDASLEEMNENMRYVRKKIDRWKIYEFVSKIRENTRKNWENVSETRNWELITNIWGNFWRNIIKWGDSKDIRLKEENFRDIYKKYMSYIKENMKKM